MKTTRALWFNWTLACGVGELAGLAMAGGMVLAARTLLDGVQLHGWLLLAALLLVGAVEGWIVGFFQWTVFRNLFLGLRKRAWMRITAIAMAASWFWGLLPSQLLASFATRHNYFSGLTLVALLVGMVTGGLIGCIQFFELRKHTTGALWWIVANALAFMASALVLYWATAYAFSGIVVSEIFMLGAFSSLAAGLVVGAVSGLFFKFFEPFPEQPPVCE